MAQLLTELQGIVGIDPDGQAALHRLRSRFPELRADFLVGMALQLAEAALSAEEEGFTVLVRPADGQERPVGDLLP